MKKNTNKKQDERVVTADGMMTFGELENGLRTADFMCCDDVALEAFVGLCKVQIMRDGNVYVTEAPKRIRRKPDFREDNMSLSLHRKGKCYAMFVCNDDEIDDLPEMLTKQSIRLADKLRLSRIGNNKKGGKRA